MGSLDWIVTIVLALLPLLLIVMAIADWRRIRRNRYLVLAGLYLLFGLSLVSSFLVATEGSTTACLSSFLFIIVLGILHRSYRRSDAATAQE